ncbi:MAG: bifunctional DNA-binding transcriptional regulator/O6-methylguanine-DNA methyltransferase Ada [Candidatus Eremiobacteraeota bacterium]|nr:bifunctional DNA-binding transcriptional regulator/O6-methylguanine-DNA methyltransferase Ada [Candidatus Eremiobacteraeota bacterium]
MDTPQTVSDRHWSAIAGRRPDETFRFGVRTTGIFCRSGCPARTPDRRNVVPFAGSAEARAAGFRPCKRCAPEEAGADAAAARLIDRAATLLAADEPPGIAEVAREVGLSRFHFQRVFRRVLGVTPGEYLRARRDERLRERLRGGGSVTEAIHEAGFGSTSRVYGEPVLGMTPGRVRSGGRGERIAFATAACSLGRVLVATSERGVCAIELGDGDADVETALAAHFPHAARVRDDAALGVTLAAAVALVDGGTAPAGLRLDVRGTAFQRRVWNALRAVGPGRTVSYAALARAAGTPGAAQAAGAACAANRLAVAIPCHRAVRENGEPAGYRWGLARKRALLEREARAE